jgi:hypothetical protein
MRKVILPRHLTEKKIGFGAIGGFAGGAIMALFIVLIAVASGLPAATMFITMGAAFGAQFTTSAVISGIGIHLLAAVVIGMIFGAITANEVKLRITTFRKGVLEGLVTGAFAFAFLYVPVIVSILPYPFASAMMTLEHTKDTDAALAIFYKDMPLIMEIGFIAHLVYGAALGAITSAISFTARTIGPKISE